jgi:predicted type IV restriction endonuclease
MQNQEKDFDFEEVKPQVERICHFITHHRELFENNEAQVKYHLVFPLLESLGWRHHPSEVILEYKTKSGYRIDILLQRNKEKVFFIEVKNLSVDLYQTISQFGKYAYEEGILYGALTNGQKWIFLKAFEPHTHLKDRIIIEINLCEDNLLKIYAVLSCLTKAKIGKFEECIHNPFDTICSLIETLREKISKTFKNDKTIDNFLLSLCRNYISICGNNSNSVSQEEEENKTSIPSVDTEQNSSNTYKVIVENIPIEANSRFKLVKKIIETALNKNWLSSEDFPILNKRNKPIIDSKRISEKNVRFFEIGGKTFYVKLGNNSDSHKSVIKALLENIKEKTGINYEVIKI